MLDNIDTDGRQLNHSIWAVTWDVELKNNKDAARQRRGRTTGFCKRVSQGSCLIVVKDCLGCGDGAGDPTLAVGHQTRRSFSAMRPLWFCISHYRTFFWTGRRMKNITPIPLLVPASMLTLERSCSCHDAEDMLVLRGGGRTRTRMFVLHRESIRQD